MKITLDEAAKMVADAQTVILTSHIRPDGDSIGSTLGLMHCLREQGKDARVLIDDEIPRTFAFCPGLRRSSALQRGHVIRLIFSSSAMWS